MNDIISIISVPNFPSLHLVQIEFEDTYYSLSNLSKILGYSTPNSLIQSVPDNLKFSVKDFYSLYTLYLDQFYSYLPMSEKQFKSTLSSIKPLWFTDLEGVKYILSRNTFTIPSLKQSLSELLNIVPIPTHRKESQFYETLFYLLQNTGIEIQRHTYLAGYFVDIELHGNIIPTVIEYDENGHKYYSKEKEKTRENAFRQLGYNIIRVDDSLNPVESASLVFKQILQNNG